MKTIILVSCLLCFIGPLASEELPKCFQLLPSPQKLEVKNGTGLFYNELNYIVSVNNSAIPVLGNICASLPHYRKKGKGIFLQLLISANIPESEEGYILELDDQGVHIQARNQKGLFYGCQTLEQLMEDSRDCKVMIPLLKITDYPDIVYRAIHLDLKHHIDSGHYYYTLIDRLAKIKVNAIIIEFEDKLRYRKAPLVGAADAISIEEFAAISRYAQDRNIEISPLVQGLGHASFILKHKEYLSLRDDQDSDWVFDPLNPKTYNLQFALYEDAIAATPCGKYLHVGGDEVGHLGKSELSLKSGKNSFELQMYWLQKVTQFANEHNRIPIFWDDMVFKLSGLYPTTYNPEISEQQVKELWAKNRPLLEKSLPLFPQECVYMRWNYSNPKLSGDLMAIDWYKEHKLNVMAATAVQGMSSMLPRNHSNFQAIKDFCELTVERKISGILCTCWDDCSPHFETVWRGLSDFACFSWNYKDVSFETTHALFRHRFYSPEMEPSSFEFQDQLESAVDLWDRTLISEGDRENYHKTFKLIDLPQANKRGEWALKYKEKISLAQNALIQYKLIKTKIAKGLEVALRNRYSLEVFNQINELQVYPSNLLIALERYDNADESGKKEAALHLKKYLNYFDELRKNFEAVYSQTRILGNPEGYQLDSNFHNHLANGTNNTDWMYMYELPMNQKILEWLKVQIISKK